MNDCRWFLAMLVMATASLFAQTRATASTPDRIYRMGDDAQEAASNGGGTITDGRSVTVLTRDSQGVTGQQQLIHLGQVNTPTYRAITGRPDGVGGFGIEFNAAQQEYLHGPNLNDPAASVSFINPGATLNYQGVFDRGLQFWVRPTSSAVQTLVMDSNQHGVRIDSTGKFSMRYANQDFASTVTVVPNNWYHVEVVRPATFANGSRMYVNGVAVATAPGGYDTDASHLAVGSNTGGDNVTFTGGTSEFFSGIIDDLELFVIGSAPICTICDPDRPAANYGSFNFAADNDFAAFTLSGVDGDLNHDGNLLEDDKDAFVAGWLNRKTVGGVQIGDLETFEQGDLNFDGITNIFDLAMMQGALSGAGLGGITDADLFGTTAPEPASLVLLISTMFAAAIRRPRRRTAR